MKEYFVDIKVEENRDVQHCLQFAFAAALNAFGMPEMRMEEIEEATGYHEVGTWPFSMIGWFADHGFEVRHIEDTNFERFIDDPQAEFRSQGLDEKAINLYFEITDFDFESAALRRALDSASVEFVRRLPEIADIQKALAEGWLPLVSLNAAVLIGRESEDFEGHMVLATGASEHALRVQDPGPPAQRDLDVKFGVVLAALRDPTENSGTVTLVRRASRKGGDQHVRNPR